MTLTEVTSKVHLQKVEEVIRFGTGGATLDAGCGDGRVAISLLRHGFHVIGCDRSYLQAQAAHSRGKRAGLPLDVCVASLTALPFRAHAFNCICCLDVLEHIRESEPVLGELGRVLTLQGRLIVTIPAILHDLFYDRVLVNSRVGRYLLRRTGFLKGVAEEGHFHVRSMVPSSVREPLMRHGLMICSLRNVSFLSTYLETAKHVFAEFVGVRSSLFIDKMIEADLKLAHHVPLILGSSWLFVFRNSSGKSS